MMSDLLKAILAMDAYNRGYNSGIDLNQYNSDGSLNKSSESLIDNYLGDLKILDTSTRIFLNNGAQNIGFYAIAYEYQGEVIISYRGTDFNQIGLDVFNGYGVALGYATGPQGMMAFEFFQAVETLVNQRNTDQNYFNDLDDDIHLTGHSLGGGLAGLVAATCAV